MPTTSPNTESVQNGLKRADPPQGNENLGTKKRLRQSCDTCKNRKTKCVTTGSGPCQYCASIGASCGISIKPRRRPFYRVSEDEYESCMALLRHFVPETELDLETMKELLSNIDNNKPPLEGAPVAGNENHLINSRPPPDLFEAEESSILQEERGCMIIDSMGKHRYVGADSSLRFNHATHAARMMGNSYQKQDPKVISPLRSGQLPPTSPESAQGSRPFALIENRYLPDRDSCMHYIRRFLQEIHTQYWFYSHEQLYTALDRILEDGGATASASRLCSLYSIFALCSARPPNMPDTSFYPKDQKSSAEYLSLAKSLVAQTCDEADHESIKALALLSLALHSACFSVSAYLMVGTTVRIAFSLGMHRNISPKSQDSMERERSRRLWWTIYLLDQEIALRLGYPCAIVDETTYIQTPLTDEEILDPGSNTPLGYQAICVSLVKLKKRISQALYVIPAQSGGKVSFQEVTNCITALRHWLITMPSHLRWDSPVPPAHRRAICILHLRYWTTVIHVARPFLLYAVIHASELTNSPKQKRYEELSHTCIEASENSVVILRKMTEYQNLSSLLLFDSGCIQELVQILILAKYKCNPVSCRQNLEFCLSAISSMDAIGWCEKILPEIQALVDESGILSEAQLQPELPGTSFNQADLNETFFDQFQDSEFNMDPATMEGFDTLDLDFGSFSPSDFYM